MTEIVQTFRKNYGFCGRTSRSQFWSYTIILGALSYFLVRLAAGPASQPEIEMIVSYPGVQMILAALLLAMAFGWALGLLLLLRRVRDAGFSIWWVIFPFLLLAAARLVIWIGVHHEIYIKEILEPLLLLSFLSGLSVFIIALRPSRQTSDVADVTKRQKDKS